MEIQQELNSLEDRVATSSLTQILPPLTKLLASGTKCIMKRRRLHSLPGTTSSTPTPASLFLIWSRKKYWHYFSEAGWLGVCALV
jgi:hypothetical protein